MVSYLDYQIHCKEHGVLHHLHKIELDDKYKEDDLEEERYGKLSGLVYFREKGTLEPRRHSAFGYSALLSPNVHEIDGKMHSDGGLFILLVEDVDIFDSLVAESFHCEFYCIMICSGIKDGQPDITSRWYLKKLHQDLKLPVLALVPCSPRGLNFLAIHRWGLTSDDYDFTIPLIKWLGFRPSDLGEFDAVTITVEMKDEDIKAADHLRDKFSKDPAWLEELDLIIKNKKYPRLSITGELLDCYLPCKLQKQDWLPPVKAPESGYYEIMDQLICSSLNNNKASHRHFMLSLVVEENMKSYLDYQKEFRSISNTKKHYRDDYNYEDEEALAVDRDGQLIGLVAFKEKGTRKPIDYGDFGYGRLLSPRIDEIDGEMWSDGGLFILLVEDIDIFNCLIAASFQKRFQCIMISSGITDRLPDSTSRWYLKKMYEDLRLPVLALVPCSPRGLMFLAIHRWGLSSDHYDFAIPDIKWLGIRPSDSRKFDVAKLSTTIEMTNEEIKDANHLRDTFSTFSSDPTWLKELELMIKNKKYPRLSISGYLVDYYLPCKLHKWDWLPQRIGNYIRN